MSWSSAVRKAVIQAFSPIPVVPRAIEWNKLVSLDFETYFDKDYTLSKLSTSEYIRDLRFKAQMVGIKIGRKKTKVVPHKNIAAELSKIDWAQYDLLCHNTAFDGLILSHHYGVIPRFYYDTLSMARGLYSNDINAGLDDVAQYLGKGSKTPDVLEKTRGVLNFSPALYKECAGYCGNDVDLTFDIFEAMAPLTPESEMRLIHMTVRMFCDPVLRVDIPRVQAELVKELQIKEEMLMSIDVSGFPDKELKLAERSLPEHEKRLLKAKKIIGSSEKFADLLRAEGIEPPVKISPSWIAKKPIDREDSKKWSYAFAKDDAAFIELPGRVDEWASHLDRNKVKDIPKIMALQERVQALVDVRISVKSTTNVTRAQRFLNASANGCALPVGYAYARAHTYRWGGNNSMNMQNLKRGGELRLSILAPKGMQLVVVDSGQIECRVNGWLWDQDDLMDAFRSADGGTGRDAYCNFADLIYGFEVTKDNKMERFVGKVAVLGLGFQMGAEKFQGTLAKGALGGPPVFFELDKCKSIVNAYRRKNHKIAGGWVKCTQIIEEMASGVTGSWKCLHWEEGRIWGPDGTSLKYPDLKKSRNEDKGWDEWTYDAKGQRKKIYGGLLCLGSKTDLLTLEGWKPIIDIVQSDLLWDGESWVTHDGLVYKGEKETIDFGGVRITPKHEVLVNEVWTPAKDTTYDQATSSCARYYRTPVRENAGSFGYGERRETNDLAYPMRLWGNVVHFSQRIFERSYAFMWVCNFANDLRVTYNSWVKQTSGICSMARGSSKMHQPESRCVGELRWTWGNSMSRVASVIRSVLGGCRAYLRGRLDLGQNRQRRFVHTEQLSVGFLPSAVFQPQKQCLSGYPGRKDDNGKGESILRYRENNSVVPHQDRRSNSTDVQQAEAVYDILNAGPNRRFTIRGNDGQPFIVHNCENIVQWLARMVVAEQILEIDKKRRVVMITHDESVAVAPTRSAEVCFREMIKAFRTAPAWCKDIPLNAEGGFAENYSK